MIYKCLKNCFIIGVKCSLDYSGMSCFYWTALDDLEKHEYPVPSLFFLIYECLIKFFVPGVILIIEWTALNGYQRHEPPVPSFFGIGYLNSKWVLFPKYL